MRPEDYPEHLRPSFRCGECGAAIAVIDTSTSGRVSFECENGHEVDPLAAAKARSAARLPGEEKV